MNTTNLFTVKEVQLTYKNHADLMQRPQLTTNKEVVNLMLEVEEMKINIDYKELFYSIYLNQNNRVLSVGKVAEGTTTNCPANIRQILQSALLQNATRLIICHNHTSGCTEPSEQDRQVTARIKNAAKLFDIQLIDSFIISSFNYFSFLESGQL
jgi:DNA repair protein RadC